MALKFCDSFDHYETSDIVRKWTINNGGTIDTTVKRNGTGSLHWTLNSQYTYITLENQALGYSTWIVGFAIRWASGPSADNTYYTVRWRDGSTDMAYLIVSATGTLQLRRGSQTGTLLVETSTTFSSGTWYYIEVKITFHSTTGSAEIRVNGTSEDSVSNVDTNPGTGKANEIWFGPNAANNNPYIDDLYICDDSGTQNNDFLGPITVEALFPDAAGDFAQWTSSTGSANWENVDETTNPDDDVSYNYTQTLTNKDTYNYDAVGISSGNIHGVIVWALARRDDVTARAIRLIARSGTTESETSDLALDTSYEYHKGVFEQDPSTNAAWTVSGINAAQFGMKLKS